MKLNQLLKNLAKIEELVSQTRDLLFCPEGKRFSIYNGLLESWDCDDVPHLITYEPDNDKEEIFNRLYWLLSNTPLTEIEDKEKYKEILSDIEIEEFPAHLVQVMNEVGIKVFNKIDKEKHKELIKQMEERYASLYNNKGL